MTGWSQHSARHWKNVWGNTLHFWGVAWPDSQRACYQSPCFPSSSVLWAVLFCLKDVVGVRLLKAEGHFCFMFAQTCLCRSHCIQERWGSMWSLTSPEWIMFLHPFLLCRGICIWLRHILFISSDNIVTWIHAWSLFSSMTFGRCSCELKVEFSLYNPMFDLSFSKQTLYVRLLIMWVCSSSTLVVSVECERRVVWAKPNHCKFITWTTDKSVKCAETI